MASQRKLDWAAIGQFLSLIVNLFTIIRDTFAEIGVDLGLIAWAVGEGKELFTKCLSELGQEYRRTQRVRVIEPGFSIEVNLETAPLQYADDLIVASHTGKGWVRVEKRPDGLYIEGRKVVLYLSLCQQSGDFSFCGFNMCEELRDGAYNSVLNANLLDVLLAHPEFVPEEWKVADVFIFFWATTFSRRGGSHLSVRWAKWRDGRLVSGCSRLARTLSRRDYAAVLEEKAAAA